jgi:hypothetical protein
METVKEPPSSKLPRQLWASIGESLPSIAISALSHAAFLTEGFLHLDMNTVAVTLGSMVLLISVAIYG